jgi:hypothetical protein
VVGQTYGSAKAIVQGGHGTQIHLRNMRGIFGYAVQNRYLGRASLGKASNGLIDLSKSGHSGGQNYGFALGRDMLEERAVGYFTGRDFEGRNTQASKKIDAVFIEGGRKKYYAARPAMILQLSKGVFRKFELAQHFQLRFTGSGSLFLIVGLGRGRTSQLSGSKSLKFYGVGSSVDGYVNELFCERQLTVVIDASFGNEKGGVSWPDLMLIYFKRFHDALDH